MIHKTYIVLILVFSFHQLMGKKIVISLGMRCDSAIQLRKDFARHYNLRDIAYPFDWLISPFEALYKCLEENFKNFLNPSFLREYDHSTGVSGVTDDYYGFQFIHDFPTTPVHSLHISELEEHPPFMGMIASNFLNHLETIQEKYARRIERFRAILSSTHDIYFIRTTITKEQAVSLHELIHHKYPNLKFTLAAIDNTPEMHAPWNIAGIKNFYVDNTFAAGSAEWAKVFRELGLI